MLTIYGVIFDVDKKDAQISELQSRTEAPDFWNDQMGAQKILQNIKSLQIWIDLIKSVNKKAESVDEFIQIAQMENDESLYDEIINELSALEKVIEEAEFKNMLSGKDDDTELHSNNSFRERAELRHKIGLICS